MEGELNLLLELPLRLVMAARSQGEPDGQAAKWSGRRTDGRTVARTRTRADGQHTPLALLVASLVLTVLTGRWGYTSNTFITSARVTDGKCAYSSFVARSPRLTSPPVPCLSQPSALALCHSQGQKDK